VGAYQEILLVGPFCTNLFGESTKRGPMQISVTMAKALLDGGDPRRYGAREVARISAVPKLADSLLEQYRKETSKVPPLLGEAESGTRNQRQTACGSYEAR
jgi:hypothetical protein